MLDVEMNMDRAAWATGLSSVLWLDGLRSISEIAGILLPIVSLLFVLWRWKRAAKASKIGAKFAKDESGAASKGAMGVMGVVGLASLALASSPVIAQFEGRSLEAYYDIVGVPTICDGITLGVEIGDVATAVECDALLVKEIQRHANGLSACVKDHIELMIPDAAGISLLSWTFNVGVGAACSSTLVRKLNAGDFIGACEQLPRWNRAGGKVIRGLSNRRGIERAMCLGALK